MTLRSTSLTTSLTLLLVCMLAHASSSRADGAGTRVAVVVRSTGFADADAAKLAGKAAGELAKQGFFAVALDDADPACLATIGCARELIVSAGARALVRLDIVRGGGNVQVASLVLDGEGRPGEEITSIGRVTAILADAPLLPAALSAALLVAVPVASSPAAAADASAQVEADAAAGAATTTSVSTVADPAPIEAAPAPDAPAPQPLAPESPAQGPNEGAASALSPLALGALGGVSLGALALVVGAVGASGQYAVARDPGAVGADKERATVLLPTLIAIGATGAGIAGVSGWLLAGELSVAPDAPNGG